jgi:transcriptional regulator with XRE-family HTH domain
MPDFRELRSLGGLTQSKIAQASGINRAKLSLAEHGEIELSIEEGTIIRKVLLQAIRDRSERINAVLSETQSETSK